MLSRVHKMVGKGLVLKLTKQVLQDWIFLKKA
jgi:hypothetical protein